MNCGTWSRFWRGLGNSKGFAGIAAALSWAQMNRPLGWLLSLVLAGTISAQMVPFILPWNDAAPGVTDLSAWNRPIDSTAKVGVDVNGHFIARGERIRFLGVNFVGDSPFMPAQRATHSRFKREATPKDTAFQLWRALHFTPAELAEPSISGEGAAPAGDGVANVLKYAYGLVPKSAARRLDLPFAELLNTDGQTFLAVSFLRAKAATEVALVPEVSPDLTVWTAGEVTTEVRRVDLGVQERILLRDRTPISAAASRYLRLRLEPAAN